MIPWLLQRIEAAVNYEEKAGLLYKAHAGLKVFALALSWIALLYASTPRLVGIALIYPVILHMLAGFDKSKYAVIASIPPVVFIAAASLLVSPYRPFTDEWFSRSLVLTGRVYGLATATLLTFSTTTPIRLASLLAVKAPLLHDLIILLYRLAPQTASDLATAYVTQRLLGKGLRDPLIGAVLAEVRRGEYIEVSLYTRGMRPSTPRTPFGDAGETLPGAILVLVSLIILTAVLLTG